MKQADLFQVDKRLLLRLLDMQPIVIFLIHNRKIVFATKGLEEVLGWKVEQVLGKSTALFFPSKEEWEEFGRRLYPILERDRAYSLEMDLVRKDGSRVACEVHNQLVENREGAPLVLASVRDVTKAREEKDRIIGRARLLKQLSKEYKLKFFHQKELLNHVLKNLPIGIAILKEGEMVYSNESIGRHLGGRLGEIISRCKFFPGKEDRAITEEKEILTVDSQDGERKILMNTISLDSEHCLVTTQDVTQMVMIEQGIDSIVDARTQQALACERLALMGKMTAEIVHEINTPLTFMKTNIHVLEAYLQGMLRAMEGCDDLESASSLKGMAEDVEEIIKSMEFGVGRIEQIVKSVRSFSRKELDKDAVTSLSDAIKDAAVLTWNRFKRRMTLYVNRVPFSKEMEVPRIGISVRGPNTALVQVFVIIIINSLDAAMGNHIKGAWLKISVSLAHGGQVLVSCVDNCGGVEGNKLRAILDPFYSSKKEGTGLGLYIVKEVVHSLGGEIEARNVGYPKGLQIDIRLRKA